LIFISGEDLCLILSLSCPVESFAVISLKNEVMSQKFTYSYLKLASAVIMASLK
jgi:hypothetical protein